MESNYPFQIKPKFSIPVFVIEISPQGPIISFVFDDSIRNLLDFNETILFKERSLSPNPVDILSNDIIFLERDIAKGRICKQKRSGINHIWTLEVNPGYKYVEFFVGGITGYTMETKMLFQVFLSNLKIKITNWYHSMVNQYNSDYQPRQFNSYKCQRH